MNKQDRLMRIADTEQELQEFSHGKTFSTKTNVVTGTDLLDLTQRVRRYKRRDCYGILQKYLREDTFGKVCILFGLRRTGKTTMLFQLLEDMTPEERKKAVYIKARV